MPATSTGSNQETELVDRLTRLIRSIESSLGENSDLLEEHAIDRCVEAARLVHPYSNAARTPHRQESILRTLRRTHAPAHVYDWNRLTLLRMLQLRLGAAEFQALPAGVREWSLTWIERMLDQASREEDRFDVVNPDGSMHWETCCDFAVAAGRFLPVGGCWVVEERRAPRDSLFGSGAPGPAHERQAIGRLAKRLRWRMSSLPFVRRAYAAYRKPLVLWREARGRYGSFLVIHTADHHLRWFSERYQEVAFANITALLQADPSLEGLYRKSWLLDPQVGEMEPRLAFLVTTPVENGARFEWLRDVDVEDQPEILSFSAVRRERYAAGSYRPQEWAYLWSRDAMVEWADSRSTRSRLEA